MKKYIADIAFLFYSILVTLIAAYPLYGDITLNLNFLSGPNQSVMLFITSFYTSWRELSSFTPPVGGTHGLLTPLITILALKIFLYIKFRNSAKYKKAVLIISSLFCVLFAFSFSAQDDKTNVFWIFIGMLWIVGCFVYLQINATSNKQRVKKRFQLLKVFGTAISFIIVILFSQSLSNNINTSSPLTLRTDPTSRSPPTSIPLDSYRQFFASDNESGINSNAPMLTISVTSGIRPDFLKIVSLDKYDGVKFTTSSSFSGSSGQISFNAADSLNRFWNPKPTSLATIELETYDYPWLPLPQSTNRITFAGADSFALENEFYYSKKLSTAFTDFSSLRLTHKPNVQYEIIYDDPVQVLHTPNDGKYFELSRRLDDLVYYSYLSRSAVDPRVVSAVSSDDKNSGDGDFEFVGSKSGQNRGHIDDAVFSKLSQIPSSCSRQDRNSPCGIVIGDEELLVTAAYIIAHELGLQARIAVGFVVGQDNTIYGHDLRAFLEVLQTTGEWERIEMSPRTDNHLPPASPQLRPMSIPTFVERPNTSNNWLPTNSWQNSPPVSNDSVSSTPATENENIKASTDMIEWIFGIVHGVGIAILMLVLLVFVVGLIPFIKLIRTQHRRSVACEKFDVSACWDELVDFLVDLQIIAQPQISQTRCQVLTDCDVTVNSLAEKINCAHFSNTIENDCWAQVTKCISELWSNISVVQKINALWSVKSLSNSKLHLQSLLQRLTHQHKVKQIHP